MILPLPLPSPLDEPECLRGREKYDCSPDCDCDKGDITPAGLTGAEGECGGLPDPGPIRGVIGSTAVNWPEGVAGKLEDSWRAWRAVVEAGSGWLDHARRDLPLRKRIESPSQVSHCPGLPGSRP